ncbi:uncharacterized protein DUF1624 [Yoonia sediminilitoris]|uniref:Uncharacterized protein DUF1624 n=2 Tax=Yoonia sediminilitoris TaxID=1286148 RepID=A0A2T6K5Q2_9RHOB|nr:uncharacterized protein DUF1624 [Yoonia sediminilitoris]RCW89636.1 uncharacterized protein DUF1624 [Yoonia sediminilitoris]
MIVFHFARDLEMFGIWPAGVTSSGMWYYLARLVAGSFLFLAGVSLVLGHRETTNWPAFWPRLVKIVVAALLITVVTYIGFPEVFIYFGILHSIAVCSLIGLMFLRLPAIFAAVAAVGVVKLHQSGFHPLNSVWWGFTGISTKVRPALDYLPLVPWLAPFLAGIAIGKIWQPRATMTGNFQWCLGWAGRHSLAVYLIHQPVLFGLIWIWVFVSG